MGRGLRLFLLGRFALTRDSPGPQHRTAAPQALEHTPPVRLPSRKAQALLAYLALHPRPHAREALAGLLWGDVPDEHARGSLRRALTLLRRHLGDDLLRADRESVQLNPQYPLWVDALDFARRVEPKAALADFAAEALYRDLQAALDLYRGDLLSDFYDDWIVRQRERYRALYLDALLQLAHWLRSHAQYDQAMVCAQTVLAQDAAHESAHQLLMQCYLTLGQHAAALKQFEACQQSLRQELAVEPSPETLALYHQIRQAAARRPPRDVTLGNLPVPLTSFVGRERELAALKRLLEATRLLTLTGTGGCGKTRLANRLAREVAREYADGVWWVELGALADASLVPQTAAKVLGVSETSRQSLTETLADFLRPKQVLLVLDNCEHLVEACAQLVEALLPGCPQLRILATSRQALNLAAESAWIVPSLTVPDLPAPPRSLEDPAVLLQHESVRLLVERAHAINPDFALTATNALAVAYICRRLDGIPLALELAAARMKILSAAQVVERLHNAFALLTTRQRTDLPRHQTLWATIDWSYALLGEPEQLLFRRLAVFAGDFALEAVESICAGEGLEKRAVLDLLSNLVDKSLVLCAEKRNQMRYRLLETIHEFARARLNESGERESVCRRHLDFYLAFVTQLQSRVPGPEEWEPLRLIDTEYDNVLAAFEWSYGNDSQVEASIEIFRSLIDLWDLYGRPSQGRRWLDRLLARSADASMLARARLLHAAGVLSRDDDPDSAEQYFKASLALRRELGDTPAIGGTLIGLGDLARMRGDDAAAQSYFEEFLTMGQASGNKRGIAGALANVGLAALTRGDYETARRDLEESLALRRELEYHVGIAWSANSLGELERCVGDYARAAALYAEALTLFRAMGIKGGVGWALQNLGHVAHHQGDYPRAESLFRESLTLFHEMGYQWGMAACLAGLAGVAGASAQPWRAGRLFGATESILQRFETCLDRADLLAYERNLAETRAQADPADFAAAWAEGRALSLEQAVALAFAP